MPRRFARQRRRLAGADLVIPMGGMLRTSGQTSATMQPPAAEAHVDFTQRCAERIAQANYRKAHPDGAGLRPLHGIQSVARTVTAATRHAAGAVRRPLGPR